VIRKHIYAISAALIIAFSGSNFAALAAQHPMAITAEAKNNVAEIRISGVIHEYQNSAQAFKRTIDDLLAQGIEDVNLYINCPGGSVFEANEIANEIERFTGTIKGFGGISSFLPGIDM
jgi:ClpP class serine protease